MRGGAAAEPAAKVELAAETECGAPPLLALLVILAELLELLELELLLSALAADGNADDTACVGNLTLFLLWASEAALEVDV